MFNKTAYLYDTLYTGMGKDYAAESQYVCEAIRTHQRRPGQTLLDVACGTGQHLLYFKQRFTATGLDYQPEMVEQACQRHPDLAIYQGDMADFDLGQRFDALTCLFSAIGYVKTPERLRQTLLNFAHHLEPGGVAVVEPWLSQETYRTGTVHMSGIDQPELKIVRMNTSLRQDHLSVMEMHYLVGTPQGVEYFTETHEIAMFTHQQYLDAFAAAGLEAHFDPKGPFGRGLYVGVKPFA